MTNPSLKSPHWALLKLTFVFFLLIAILGSGIWLLYSWTWQSSQEIREEAPEPERKIAWESFRKKYPDLFDSYDWKDLQGTRELFQLRPVGTIRESHPKFQWQPITGATSYIISVFNPLDDVVFRVKTSETTCEWPPNTPGVVPGETYSLRLVSENFLGPLMETKEFQRATQEKMTLYANALGVLAAEVKKDEGMTLLALQARLALQYGFLDDAEGFIHALPDGDLEHQALIDRLRIHRQNKGP